MKDRVHLSKIDGWLLGVVAVSALMGVGACLPALRGHAAEALLVALPTMVVALGLPSWLIASTSYTITDTELRIRSGPFHWTIPLCSITAVTPTRNPLSSPALSLDRLRIDYGGKFILVSPREKGRFVDDLRERGAKI